MSVLVTGCSEDVVKTIIEKKLNIVEEPVVETGMVFEDGKAQPILMYSDLRDPYYSNEESEIIRYCVYVETDYDTDFDGKADLVKVLMQVPRKAVEGEYHAATIFDPTPYNAGTVDRYDDNISKRFVEKEFDYNSFYKECEKRTPENEISTMEAALQADPSADWNYSVPYTYDEGYYMAQEYDYYLIRGFAVAQASGIGTYGSEGFAVCGLDLERDAQKCVVEWLAGNRVAYTDTTNNVEIKADWSNGNVAMTGCSYGGTLPFEVATTGVEGLKTIIPFAGIASWYDYTNSQGVSLYSDAGYGDWLASYVSGATFEDDDWYVTKDAYGKFLYQYYCDQSDTNGDFGEIWDRSNYSDDYENISCSALIVHGLNDLNVSTKQSDLMYKAFQKAGQNAKLILHQDGHNILDGISIKGELWQDIMNKWLSHYLYDVENDIENMPALTVQSNVNGEFMTFDSWESDTYLSINPESEKESRLVSSKEYAQKWYDYEGDTIEEFYLNFDEEQAAIYDIQVPAKTQIVGIPEIQVKLSTTDTNLDGLMVSAALIDTLSIGDHFKAFMPTDMYGGTLPLKTIDHFEMGGEQENGKIYKFVPSNTNSKLVTIGWTDLRNPGFGYSINEYKEPTDLVENEYYDYTIYLQPTAYTVQPGHVLKLIIFAWDPYKDILEESCKGGKGAILKVDSAKIIEKKTSEGLEVEKEEVVLEDFSYSFSIDCTSITAKIPIKMTEK